jgi:hypothetical protein
MKREEIEKLLGGYATDSLTPEERQTLFTAALEDQSLFDELAREESLRAALADPAARAQALAALDAAPEPWRRRLFAWFGRPAGLTALAGAAAAVITVGVFVNYRADRPKPAMVTQVAPGTSRPDVEPPAAPAAAPPTAPTPGQARAARARTAAQAPAGPPAEKPAPERNEQAAARPPAAAPPTASTPGQARAARAKTAAPAPAGPPAEKPAVKLEEQAAAKPLSATAGASAGAGGVIGGIVSAPAPGAVAPPPPPPPPPLKARKEAVAEVEKKVAAAEPARANQLAATPAAAPAPTTVATARSLFDAVGSGRGGRDEAKDAAPQSLRAAPERRMAAGRMQNRADAPAPAPALASAVAVPHLGLRYSVLRLSADGASTAIDETTVFNRGDRVRLVFESNDAGYLYVLQREASGGWRQLAGERIERRSAYAVPREGALAYDEPGVKQIYVFFSRTPEPSLAAPDPNTLDQRLRGSLLVQKGEAGATYVVNASNAPQAQQVGHTIALRYR